MKVVCIIPARYESKRFPGKVLQEIEGKTIIQRVFE
jgi:CMP-2-keto-3-deoxyoctulosonic acid synthetase